MDLRLRQLVHH
ncbi:BgTH12-00876 [Blumeria graminis f. sp. triticale]|uniref:BgTH12-00876 n=1 Tax=Blumeria graminis f. sp. triticale TaxID=1689686 RepID=A0A9W4GIY9_BLUGR|nr:BgTH12-00876 [Blumeria graminis f. sp. triticale]